jgi:diaminopimelate epimerase
VTTRVRETADLEAAVDQLLDIYTRAMTEHQRRASSDGSNTQSCADAQRAAARHLRSVALRLKGAYELEAAVHMRSGELAAARSRHDLLVHEREALLRQVEILTNEVAAAGILNQHLTDERDALQQLVAAYRALPSLRLRDGLIRMPILGSTAQRAARWLTRSASPR